MQLKPGTLLQGGKYRIDEVLGKGGFGITYLAYQPGLNRKVAIKEFFMKEYCEREDTSSYVTVPSVGCRELVDQFKSKFLKEAMIISDLDNPHIISIFDIFEENATVYYVMKYIEGGSLSSIVAEGDSLSVEIALKLIAQVADALKYCHERKIVHLDVKPGNILVQDGNAVLIDFGVSKHYDDEGGQTSSTPVGISKGYAPIEQYKKGGVRMFSPATDIYSLGATLYRLVVGKTPPDASDLYEDGLPEFPTNIPLYIQKAIIHAMSPKKKDRPQCIDDFMALLVDSEKNDSKENTEILGTGVKKMKMLNWVFGLICLLVAVGYIAAFKWLADEEVQDDAEKYTELIVLMDSLGRADGTLREAMKVSEEAQKFEEQYADTRHADLFGCNAAERLSSALATRKLVEDLNERKNIIADHSNILGSQKAQEQKNENFPVVKKRSQWEDIEFKIDSLYTVAQNLTDAGREAFVQDSFFMDYEKIVDADLSRLSDSMKEKYMFIISKRRLHKINLEIEQYNELCKEEADNSAPTFGLG